MRQQLADYNPLRIKPEAELALLTYVLVEEPANRRIQKYIWSLNYLLLKWRNATTMCEVIACYNQKKS